MLGYLPEDIICSSKLTVFLELRPRKTVLFLTQIMFEDKYPNIFSCQMDVIVQKFTTRPLQNVPKESHIYFDAFSPNIQAEVQFFIIQMYFQNVFILFFFFFFTFSVVGLYFFSAFFINLILAVTFFIGANSTVLCKSAADLSLLENVSN